MENKKLIGAIIVLVIVLVGVVWIIRDSAAPAEPQSQVPQPPKEETPPYNTTYLIDGESITLSRGKAEEAAAPGSAEMVLWELVEQPVSGHLNGDDKWDAAMILRRSGAGSGVFYYAVAAIFTPEGPETVEGFPLGDRIVPQSILVDKGHAVVTYLDRAPGEPMTAPPSVPVTKMLMAEGGRFTEVTGAH